MTTPVEKLISSFKLFWQYPVITEKTFFEQNKYDPEFLAFPWATILDKSYNIDTICKIITENLNLENKKYTCCQHIYFKKLIPMFKKLGIKILYTPHKIINEDHLDGIQIKPCPLYAVNVEDQNRNAFLKDLDLINKQRNITFSFMGAYQENCYLTRIRKNVFKLPKNKNNVIIDTGSWYFNHIVYSQKQNYNTEINKKLGDEERKNKYNGLLVNSKFTLCPSGSGPNSIRFWEALACGSVPVLLSDTLDLPEHDLWETSIVKVKECDIFKINSILSSISETEIKARRDNCIKIYNFFKDNFKGCTNFCCEYIPNILFTSYSCKKNNIINDILNKWKLINPRFEIKYFSDADLDVFFKNTPYNDIYKNLKNGVSKSDFFRICYIYLRGGIWFDIDLSPVKIKPFKNNNIQLYDLGYKNISYMVIGAKPKQILFKKIINKVSFNILNYYQEAVGKDILWITGPRNIQEIYCKILNIPKNYDGILKGTEDNTIFLENSPFKFYYKLLKVNSTKINEYDILQKMCNKKQYSSYNYI